MEIKIKMDNWTTQTIAAVAGHRVMQSIAWTDLQRSRTACIEHAEMLMSVVDGDYVDGMTAVEVRRKIIETENEIGDYDYMAKAYARTADRIAAELDIYVREAAKGDKSARHVLCALRKRNVWARICKAADNVDFDEFCLSRALLDIYNG